MRLKVCGMRDPQNIAQVAILEPDYMGFIFYEESPRFAGATHSSALDMLHPLTKRVGVFVNAGYDHILETIEKYKLDMVQLHSEEPPEICRSLQEHAGIIKAFGIGSASDFCRIADYEGACDLYVFDTKTPAYGGSGRKFDHRLLSFYKGQTPYLLSGGISVDDMSSGLNNYDKLCIGFDINSRFETSPGVKDPELIKTFLELIKNKDNEQDR